MSHISNNIFMALLYKSFIFMKKPMILHVVLLQHRGKVKAEKKEIDDTFL